MSAKWSSGSTQFLDWQEVWCFRCYRDHDWSHTGAERKGCPLIAQALTGEPVAEWDEAAYEIDVEGADGTETIPVPLDPCNIPAPIVCRSFTPCGPGCRTHPNGAVIVWRGRAGDRPAPVSAYAGEQLTLGALS